MKAPPEGRKEGEARGGLFIGFAHYTKWESATYLTPLP